jgi:uncharacterized membrane protein
MTDTRSKSALKSVSYIILHEIFLFALIWIVTGEPLTAATIASIWVVIELVFYYLHERFWNNVQVKLPKRKHKE